MIKSTYTNYTSTNNNYLEGPPTKKRQICGPHQRGCSLYETAQIPVPAEARNRRLPRASSRKLHSSPRSGKNGSSREETVDCSSESAQQRQGVLADRPNPSRQTLCLNHRRQLREPLRLLLHSYGGPRPAVRPAQLDNSPTGLSPSTAYGPSQGVLGPVVEPR
jgi:hypothetical protein